MLIATRSPAVWIQGCPVVLFIVVVVRMRGTKQGDMVVARVVDPLLSVTARRREQLRRRTPRWRHSWWTSDEKHERNRSTH